MNSILCAFQNAHSSHDSSKETCWNFKVHWWNIVSLLKQHIKKTWVYKNLGRISHNVHGVFISPKPRIASLYSKNISWRKSWRVGYEISHIISHLGTLSNMHFAIKCCFPISYSLSFKYFLESSYKGIIWRN